MDMKIKIKEEGSLSYNVDSQNEREFLTNSATMRKNSDAVLLDDDCDVAIKTEMKSETAVPDCSSQKGSEYCKKQIKSETATSSNCEAYMKTEVEEQTVVSDFGSQSNTEFLSEDSVMKFKKCNSDNEVVAVKVESQWLETETSSGFNDIVNRNFPPVRSSRLCPEAVPGDGHVNLSLPFAKVSGADRSSYKVKDPPECESQEFDVMEIPTVEEHVLSKEYGKCSNGKVCNRVVYSKQNHLIHKVKDAKKSHQCRICNKCFTRLSSLKAHCLIHEGKRPHQCKACLKSFTQLSDLKRHILIHEGMKPYQCKTCDKSFTHLSNFNRHVLIHDGKKPHQCKTCGKSFTHSSNFNKHILIHEGKKPYHCKSCGKSFTQLITLKRHKWIHEGTKPHQCKTCYKSFTRLSHLKKHNMNCHRNKVLPV